MDNGITGIDVSASIGLRKVIIVKQESNPDEYRSEH